MPYKSDAQRKAVHANKNKSGLKILTSEHIKETQKTYFDNKIGEQSKELLSIPKFEGDIFFKDRLTRTNKRVRPEFKITVKSGKLNKYIIIDTKSNKEMQSTIRNFKRKGLIQQALRLKRINDRLNENHLNQ
jgi:hypothetical protein